MYNLEIMYRTSVHPVRKPGHVENVKYMHVTVRR